MLVDLVGFGAVLALVKDLRENWGPQSEEKGENRQKKNLESDEKRELSIFYAKFVPGFSLKKKVEKKFRPFWGKKNFGRFDLVFFSLFPV